MDTKNTRLHELVPCGRVVADDTTAKLYIFNYNSDRPPRAMLIDDIALVEKTDDFIMDGGFSRTLDGVVDTNAYLVPAGQ